MFARVEKFIFINARIFDLGQALLSKAALKNSIVE